MPFVRSEPLQFFNPLEEITITGTKLPHWEQAGAAYFVTFRLADSLPSALLRSWEHERAQWRAHHPEPWDDATRAEYQRLFAARLDGWLDEGHGACLLRDPAHREVVEQVLQHDHRRTCFHHARVLMPNHVHLLFSLRHDVRLADAVRTWKSVSARRLRAMGAAGVAVWQRDYFDRLTRDAEHFANGVRYIRRNPQKAGLGNAEHTLWEGPLAQAIGER